ncbi:MAG TPA: hypothetical protein VL860_11075, partial [Planctomycetota bacterium]|nr:hypothetical protein [Planctomycetota bacterium]
TRKARRGDAVVFADDGRDFYREQVLRTACMRGFAEEGLRVLDIGVAPTPAAVIYAAHIESRLVCVLTASHNPANQNGLKFFVDGFKLLPDGEVSDRVLTREIIQLANDDAAPTSRSRSQRMSAVRRSEGEDSLLASRRVFLQSGVPMLSLVPWQRSRVEILFDASNGAGTVYGLDMLKKLGVRHRAINVHPDGANINAGGGVAEIEGHAAFHGQHRPADKLHMLPVVKHLILRGRENGTRLWTVAIVLDGDGDRGYLLVYGPEYDTVYVIAGDALAYILASIDARRGGLPLGATYVTTVEGDLMAPLAAEQNLGLKTLITCVGDKWLTQPAREGGAIAAAAEDAGYVIKTQPVTTVNGGMRYVNTGNGLMTTLQVIGGVITGEFPQDRVIQPFAMGFKQSAHTYFVDRAKFMPGTPVWRLTEQVIERQFRLARSQQTDPVWARLTLHKKHFDEDPSMLFYSLEEPGSPMVASIFVRNSGTEIKTTINVRGQTAFFGVCHEILEAVHAEHLKHLKDENSLEFAIERRVLLMLKKKGPVAPDRLLKILNIKREVPFKQADLDAVMFALSKERRVRIAAKVALV